MSDNKIVGYKNIFGFILPDWVDEGLIRLMVSFLISSVVMLFVLIFVIWPKMTIIASMKSKLVADQSALKALETSKSGFDKLNEQIPESTQNLIISAIPQAYSPENAISSLRKISAGVPGLSIVSYKLPSGVLFETKNNQVEKNKTKTEPVIFHSYPIKLVVTAPVNALLQFITKIENTIPFGVVSDLGMQEISKLAKSTATRSVQMELEITYFQAILNQVDITKIKPISENDMQQVDKMSSFTITSSAFQDNQSSSSAIMMPTESLFGI